MTTYRVEMVSRGSGPSRLRVRVATLVLDEEGHGVLRVQVPRAGEFRVRPDPSEAEDVTVPGRRRENPRK